MIRVGIIGGHPDKGWATTAHIPALKLRPEFEITAISHHQEEIARAAAAKFGIPHALTSAESLARHADVDLVVVAVKVIRHWEVVTAALAAGKSILCEWPLGVNRNEAAAMRAIATAREVNAFVGLQTRAAPAVDFVRERVKSGWIGEVLSTTLVGSGLLWGESMSDAYEYTLEPLNGAGMLPVTFGHSIDAVLYALDSKFASVQSRLATRRKSVRLTETDRVVPMAIPDQIAVSGMLENGVFVNAHFRGGISRATNFHWEINGTAGDLVVTSPTGYTGVGGFRVQGARGDETLHDLEVSNATIPEITALAYARIASDILSGTRLAPTFAEAVALHELLAKIEHDAAL